MYLCAALIYTGTLFSADPTPAASTPAATTPVAPVGKTDEQITEKEVLALIDKTVKLIQKEGEAALAKISTTGGEFHDGELYAFVYDVGVVMLAHPANPKLIGQSLKGKPDMRGKKFRDDIVTVALAGGGWTEYVYQKPGATGIFKKRVYSKVATKDGKKYIVAVGMYGGKE